MIEELSMLGQTFVKILSINVVHMEEVVSLVGWTNKSDHPWLALYGENYMAGKNGEKFTHQESYLFVGGCYDLIDLS